VNINSLLLENDALCNRQEQTGNAANALPAKYEKNSQEPGPCHAFILHISSCFEDYPNPDQACSPPHRAKNKAISAAAKLRVTLAVSEVAALP
jgi:hypothetical protein